MTADLLLGLGVGIGLAAACGLRVFAPLLVMSLAARADQLDLAGGFQWIAATPALIAFAVATALEIAAYFIPWVDHLLDVAAAPLAVAAGSLAMAGAAVGLDPFLRWSLAIIAGGGIAGLLQGATGATRLGSTLHTGGLANPVLAGVETGGAIALAVLAVLLPLAALLAVAGLGVLAARAVVRGTRRVKN